MLELPYALCHDGLSHSILGVVCLHIPVIAKSIPLHKKVSVGNALN